MPEEEEEEDKEEEETVYVEKGREEQVESGEISPEEEGFMKGYEDADEEKEENKEEEE